MSNLDMAKVEISLGDLQSLQNKIRTLEGKLSDAEKAKDEVILGAPESEARAYREAFEASLNIVKFAIANLHPLTVRGWPYEALREVATHLQDRAGVSGFDREAVNDWRLFANEAAKWEDARAKGIEQEMLAEENAASAPLSVPGGLPEEPVLPTPGAA